MLSRDEESAVVDRCLNQIRAALRAGQTDVGAVVIVVLHKDGTDHIGCSIDARAGVDPKVAMGMILDAAGESLHDAMHEAGICPNCQREEATKGSVPATEKPS
jgi:hypothetical protein